MDEKTNKIETIEMFESITAEIIEAITLLEIIYRDSRENHETDCAIACLIRSLYKTKEKADSHVIELTK